MFTFLSRLKLLFSRIQTGQDAADFLGEVATMFYLIAAIQAAVGLLVLGDVYFLIDAAVYAGLATWIFLKQSTIAAILAARPNDIAASGPPSEIARMDLNIASIPRPGHRVRPSTLQGTLHPVRNR